MTDILNVVSLVVNIIIGPIAIISLLISVWTVRHERQRGDLDIFSRMLEQLSGEEASVDRGLVKQMQAINDKEQNIARIRELVDSVRAGMGEHIELGKAVERTIARLDRVGFFLLADSRKPRMKPPIWLWTITNDMWKRLGDWVEFRQNQNSGDQYYHRGYGYYFGRLASCKQNGTGWAK